MANNSGNYVEVCSCGRTSEITKTTLEDKLEQLEMHIKDIVVVNARMGSILIAFEAKYLNGDEK